MTTPAAGDTEDPSVPTGLQTTAVTDTSVSLSWNAATDNVAVTDYIVTRNGVDLAPVTGTTLVDGLLAPGATYTYTVRARDAAGNSSDPSSPPLVATDDRRPRTRRCSATASRAPTARRGAPGGPRRLSNGTATQQSGTGELAFNDVASAYARAQLSGLTARADSDTTFSFQFNSTTAIQYVTAFTRGSGGWQGGWRPMNGYGIEMRNNSGTIELIKNVNGTQTTLATVTGAKAVSTAKQWLRLRVVGSTIQFKSWVDGTTEPVAWESTVTDTSVTAAGQLHLSTIRGGSNSGAKNVRIDDLTVLPGSPGRPEVPGRRGDLGPPELRNAVQRPQGVVGPIVCRSPFLHTAPSGGTEDIGERTCLAGVHGQGAVWQRPSRRRS